MKLDLATLLVGVTAVLGQQSAYGQCMSFNPLVAARTHGGLQAAEMVGLAQQAVCPAIRAPTRIPTTHSAFPARAEVSITLTCLSSANKLQQTLRLLNLRPLAQR